MIALAAWLHISQGGAVMAIQSGEAWSHGVHRNFTDVIGMLVVGGVLLALLPVVCHLRLGVFVSVTWALASELLSWCTPWWCGERDFWRAAKAQIMADQTIPPAVVA